MTNKPVILDLFCGAGGAAMGYYRASFDVIGVDIKPQPRYPFEFHQADALEYVRKHGAEFDAIHASPPCQAYSKLKSLHKKQYADLVSVIRDSLEKIGKPYAIENVVGAPLKNPLMLCGTMFGLRVIRHRLFEVNPPIYFPPRSCCHNGRASGNKSFKRETGIHRTPRLKDFEFLTITGHDFIVSEARIALGINWMSQKELSQAIPPAYTEFIGGHLLNSVRQLSEIGA